MDPNDDRYLGRAAYEGYCHASGHVSLASGDALPVWTDLDDKVRKAWATAASAVERELAARRQQEPEAGDQDESQGQEPAEVGADRADEEG